MKDKETPVDGDNRTLWEKLINVKEMYTEVFNKTLKLDVD